MYTKQGKYDFEIIKICELFSIMHLNLKYALNIVMILLLYAYINVTIIEEIKWFFCVIKYAPTFANYF